MTIKSINVSIVSYKPIIKELKNVLERNQYLIYRYIYIEQYKAKSQYTEHAIFNMDESENCL